LNILIVVQKSGINRVRLLAKADSAAAQLLERGIAKSLVEILDKHQNQDPGLKTSRLMFNQGGFSALPMLF
jgi:hypothetical protein